MKNFSALTKIAAMPIVFLLISLAVISLIAETNTYAGNFTVPAIDVQPQGGIFSFPVSEFQDGKAKHFSYKVSPNQSIRFLVIKSSDGVIRAAFDACEVCYRAQKGYVQQGNNMICINCGRKFKSDKVNEVTGGCNPSALKRTLKDSKVFITQQDVLAGAKYFQ
ncbi:MAG: DUF2318 domain-containing protein [Syntrophaceae bacterium]|nr:DUF2318 domain-containing protein [Syntrophaceae bacterium]